MKGRHHIIVGIILLVMLGVLLAFVLGSRIFEIIDAISLIVLILGILLYLIGLILPDSDSWDAESKIFHSPFFFLGWVNRLIEYPLSLILGRQIGHRQSLHTFAGVLLSSLVVSLIFSFALVIFTPFFDAITLPFLFLSLLLGQLVHLLEDFHFRVR